jgi:peptidoglycan/xylan/chitin deacetylase (PgdA/CDA1 family)
MTSSSYLNSVYDIPILAYHKVSPQGEIGLTTIHPDNFEKQIGYLHVHGYQTVTFRDLLDPTFERPEKPVILTFDDGYESIHQIAAPVLEKYGFRSVIAIISGFIGGRNTWEAFRIQRRYMHLTCGQIRQLHAAGHEIASHSVTHPYMPALPLRRAEAELKNSKNELEDMTGTEIITFCYPYGRRSRRLSGLLAENGYKFASVNAGFFPKKSNDVYALPRTSIYASDSLDNFITKIGSYNQFGLTHLAQWIIQRGALAGVVCKTVNQIITGPEK